MHTNAMQRVSRNIARQQPHDVNDSWPTRGSARGSSQSAERSDSGRRQCSQAAELADEVCMSRYPVPTICKQTDTLELTKQ